MSKGGHKDGSPLAFISKQQFEEFERPRSDTAVAPPPRALQPQPDAAVQLHTYSLVTYGWCGFTLGCYSPTFM
eukprot:337951-Prorocentrum_minimum.AAC.2